MTFMKKSIITEQYLMFSVLRDNNSDHEHLYLDLKASTQEQINKMIDAIRVWNTMPWSGWWEVTEDNDIPLHGPVIVTAASLIYAMTHDLEFLEELMYKGVELPTEEAETWLMHPWGKLPERLIGKRWWARMLVTKVFHGDEAALEWLRPMQPLAWEWRRSLSTLFPEAQLQFKPFSIPLITIAKEIKWEDPNTLYPKVYSIIIEDAWDGASYKTITPNTVRRAQIIKTTPSTVQEIFRQCQEFDRCRQWCSISNREMYGFFDPTVTFVTRMIDSDKQPPREM